jgi:glycogen operon protein
MKNPGEPHPLGATPVAGGVNFSVFAKHATGLELLLFDGVDDDRPAHTIRLEPQTDRSYHYWHARVNGIGPGQLYAFRANGPGMPELGLRFDAGKTLLDPYGRAVAVPRAFSRAAARRPGDNTASAMKSVVVDPARYDWEGDRPLARPFGRSVIYEMHVRGFTRHESSGVPEERRGTFAGLVDKIPYLVDLGITAVELLPVFQYDPQDAPPGLVNYWGYSPVSFFAPHVGYCSRRDPLGPLDEFRDMVKALHRAGIEVLLDVVYNHTAEGGRDGPTYCFRGLGNDTYYLLEREDRARYADFTGTGNTLNAGQAVVRRMIVDSLRYWVTEMHVDGFRFDLASILARDENGLPIANPPVLWDIETDPVLARTKLIAEAWDGAGLYQVGSFVGDSWKEWNGKFRDDVRRFVRGDGDSVSGLATRLLGSPDLYAHEEREPEQSVHFVTCHDGFTLNDLVSYERKHNLANGEHDRDGSDDNLSSNCGVEGPTDDPAIERLRNRQVKNFLALNLVAIGAPMLSMGDEMRRTQGGNNNAYCQDNETSWLDWRLLARHADVHRFVKHLVRSRLEVEEHGLTLNQLLRAAHIEWHGVEPGRPDWSHSSHSLAVTASMPHASGLYHFLFNAYREPLDFRLPPVDSSRSRPWRRWVDTARPSPEDIVDPAEAPDVQGEVYRVEAYSVVALFAEDGA